MKFSIKNLHKLLFSLSTVGSNQPLTPWMSRILSSRVKRPKREADYSHLDPRSTCLPPMSQAGTASPFSLTRLKLVMKVRNILFNVTNLQRRFQTEVFLALWRTAQLTSRRCILNIYSTNILTEYFKHATHSPFFFFFKMPFISLCYLFLVPVTFTFYIQSVLKF